MHEGKFLGGIDDKFLRAIEIGIKVISKQKNTENFVASHAQ